MSPTATFYHGKNTDFVVGTFGAPTTITTNISNVLRSVTFPRPVDTAETSAFGTSAKTFVPGMTSGTLSFDGMFDATVEGILSACLGGDILLGWKFGPSGSTSGRTQYTQAGSTSSGTGVGLILTSLSDTAPVGDIVGFSADFQIVGVITRTTY